MADTTKRPALVFFQWSRPDEGRPALSAPLNAEQTTAYFTSAPKDEDGNVITSPFLFGIKRSDGYVETVYAPNGADGASGKSATALIRGIALAGLDFSTRDATLDVDHQGGEEVFCNITGVYEAAIAAVLSGTICTNGNNFIIGTDASGTVTISRSTGTGTYVGFARWFSSNNKSQYSNDGISWVNHDDAAASTLALVSANDTSAGYLNGKLSAGDGIDFTENNDGGNEDLEIAADVTDFIDTDYGLTENTNNIRINLATDEGLYFNSGALGVKLKPSGGVSIDSDGLYVVDLVNQSKTFKAYESITAGNAVGLLPVENRWFDQLTETDLALGDANARRRRNIQFSTTQAVAAVPNMLFRFKKFSSGQDVTVRIETDNSGEPSGTLVDANATATISAGSIATSYATETATWAGSFSLSADTTYHIVFQVPSSDGTNYIAIGSNSSYDENYLTFTTKIFDLDAGTWGSSATNSTPFFWFADGTHAFGMGLAPTDANWGGRTWTFIGFASSTVSALEEVDTYIDTVPGLSNLIENREYFLSTTPGAISLNRPGTIHSGATVPTAFDYKIGEAISTTELKIRKGQKRVVIHENSALTSSTTRQYLTWFEPQYVRVYGSHIGGNNSTISLGYILGSAVDGSIASTYVSSGAGSLNTSTSNSISDDSSGSSDFTGSGADFTRVGFTYTYTEAGTSTLVSILEAIA